MPSVSRPRPSATLIPITTSTKCPATPEKSEATSHLSIDFDEAVHAAGAIASKAGIKAAAVLMGINAALLVAGAYAGKCGWEEFKEAKENEPILDADLASSEEEFDEISRQKLEVDEKLQLMRLEGYRPLEPKTFQKEAESSSFSNERELSKENVDKTSTQEFAAEAKDFFPSRAPRNDLAFMVHLNSLDAPDLMNYLDSPAPSEPLEPIIDKETFQKFLDSLPTSEPMSYPQQIFRQAKHLRTSIHQQCQNLFHQKPLVEILKEEKVNKTSSQKFDDLAFMKSLNSFDEQAFPQLLESDLAYLNSLNSLAFSEPIKNLLLQKQQLSPEKIIAIKELEKDQEWLLSKKLNAQLDTEAILSNVEMNHDNKGIGITTLSSGVIIAFKGFMELIGPFLPSIISAGAFSALTFTPAAAICAVALGVYFIHKSVSLRNARQADKKAFNEFLEEPSIKELRRANPLVNEYLNECEETIKKGERFDTYFLLSNYAFLTSSIIYTLGVIGEAVALAVGGPSPSAIITFVGQIAPSLSQYAAYAMGVGSLQFFFGHEIQKNNDEDRTKDMPNLDRYLLAVVDRALNEKEGVKFRAESLEYYRRREEARQKFLKEASFFKERFSLGLSDESVQKWLATPKGKQALAKFMLATLRAEKAYLKEKNTILQKIPDANGSADGVKNFSLQEKISLLKEKTSDLAKQNGLLINELKKFLLKPELLELELEKFVEIKKRFFSCQNAALPEIATETEEEQSIDELLTQYSLLKESYKPLLNKLVETEFQAGRLRNAQEKPKTQFSRKAEFLRAPAQTFLDEELFKDIFLEESSLEEISLEVHDYPSSDEQSISTKVEEEILMDASSISEDRQGIMKDIPEPNKQRVKAKSVSGNREFDGAFTKNLSVSKVPQRLLDRQRLNFFHQKLFV